MVLTDKRLFIGGLVHDVTQQELTEKFSRFGTVHSIQIKTRHHETEIKPRVFAYLNLCAEEDNFKKCFAAYSNTKWKGGQLILQYAKQSFLNKLEKERKDQSEKDDKELNTKDNSNPPYPITLDPKTQKAVPGTIVDELGNWVVGKYSRVLPVLHLKRPQSRKLVTLDPSKALHALKKIKENEQEHLTKTIGLTWHIEVKDTEMTKKRKGQFPSWKPKKTMRSVTPQQAPRDDFIDDELEVVGIAPLDQNTLNGDYESDQSSLGSANTDEIISQSQVSFTRNVQSHKQKVDISSHEIHTENEDISNEDNPCKQTTTIPKQAESHIQNTDVSKWDDPHEQDKHHKQNTDVTTQDKHHKQITVTSLDKHHKKNTDVARLDNFEKVDISKHIGLHKQNTVSRPDNTHKENNGISRLDKTNKQNTDVFSENEFHTQNTDACVSQLEKLLKQNSDVFIKDKSLRQNRQDKSLKQNADVSRHKPLKQNTDDSEIKVKHLEERGWLDNKKRLNAMEERMKEKTRQQNLIKKALQQNTVPVATNKKRFFSSDEEDVDKDDDSKDRKADNTLKTKSESKQQLKLFESSEESDDNDDPEHTFRLRQHLEGEKGKKLITLQSRYGPDHRFRLDERFLEDTDDETLSSNKEEESMDGEEMGIAEERERSFKILEKVLGHEVKRRNPKELAFKDMNLRRYIPGTKTSKTLEIPATNKSKKKKRNMEEHLSKTNSDADNADDETNMLSEENESHLIRNNQERSFEVAANLKDLFVGSSRTSFTFLSADSTLDVSNSSSNHSLRVNMDQIKTSGEDVDRSPDISSGPGNVTRSESDQSGDNSDSPDENNDTKHSNSKLKVFSEAVSVPETFFFQNDDPRLQVGVNFFLPCENFEKILENWSSRRHSLVEVYKQRHKRYLRKLSQEKRHTPRGRK